MDNTNTLTRPEPFSETTKKTSPDIDSGMLFNLVLNIQTGFPLLDKPRRFLDRLLPEMAQFLIISGDNFIHPESVTDLPTSTLIGTVKHSEPGIFCRRLELNRWDNNQKTSLCAISLGCNRRGQDTTAGILYDETTVGRKAVDHFYDLLLTLQRFYADLTRSRAIEQLMSSRTTFRYVLKADNFDLVSKRLPIGSNSTDDSLAETIYHQVVNGHLKGETDIALNNRVKNYGISHFRLGRFEYYLLSFEIIPGETVSEIEHRDNDNLLGAFAHKLKNKLSALQSAASQFSLQPGKIVDSDDITLSEIIQANTAFIDHMTNRFCQLCTIEPPKRQKFDIVKLVKSSLTHLARNHKPSGKISFGSDAEFGMVNADMEQIETVLFHILENAFEAGGDISVELYYSDPTSIIIQNSLTDETYESLSNANLNIMEPFVSLKPNKIGLGLPMAEKILTNHNGRLRNEIDAQNGMTVEITLPV